MSTSLTFTIAGGEEAEAFKEKIRAEATAKGLSMSELIVDALADYFRKQNEH